MPKSKERCKEIREETRTKILQKSILYFARNGFAGTKISDLAKHIGVAPGTLYIYFASKEELFRELYKAADVDADIKKMKFLSSVPLPAKVKIHKLSVFIIDMLSKEEGYAAKITLNAQMMLEKGENESVSSTYQSDLYHYTEKIIKQGQKENSIVEGSAMKLADYYWSVVYLYSLKQLFTSQYEMLETKDLERILLKDGGLK